MKDVEKNVCCVLLDILARKSLIPPNIHEKARCSVLGTLDEREYFCYCEEKTEEEPDGHTQNPC